MTKRKLLALLLALTTAGTSLTACGDSSTGNSSNSASSDNKNKDTYEVIIETVTLGADYKDIPAIEEAINAITVPAINCTVSILPIGIADHANKMSMMISGGEKLDLCMVGLTTNLASMASDGMLYSMNDYIDTYGTDLKELFGNDLSAGCVGDQLYAIPSNNANAKACGFIYNKSMADEAGVSIPDNCTVDELEDYYTQIKENLADKYPDLYLTSCGAATTGAYDCMYQVDKFGDSYGGLGVIVDSIHSTTIENWYETDEAKEYYHRMKDWHDNGYIPTDSLTSGVITSDMFKANQIFAMTSDVSPAEKPSQASSYSFDIGMARITDIYKNTDSLQQRMWGIPVTSEHPEKAMEFLNLLYSNTDIANLLTNGLEGVNYENTDVSGIINKIDADAPGYARIFTWFGDQTKIDYATPAEEGIQDEIKTFADEAQVCKTLGYVFDNSSVAAQSAAVSNVIQQYSPALETGIVDDVDKALNQIVEEMNTAGMHEVVAENQKQLDAWLSTNK